MFGVWCLESRRATFYGRTQALGGTGRWLLFFDGFGRFTKVIEASKERVVQVRTDAWLGGIALLASKATGEMAVLASRNSEMAVLASRNCST